MILKFRAWDKTHSKIIKADDILDLNLISRSLPIWTESSRKRYLCRQTYGICLDAIRRA